MLKTEIDSTNVSKNLSVLLMTEYPLGWEVSPLNFLLLAIDRAGYRQIAMQTSAISSNISRSPASLPRSGAGVVY